MVLDYLRIGQSLQEERRMEGDKVLYNIPDEVKVALADVELAFQNVDNEKTTAVQSAMHLKAAQEKMDEARTNLQKAQDDLHNKREKLKAIISNVYQS